MSKIHYLLFCILFSSVVNVNAQKSSNSNFIVENNHTAFTFNVNNGALQLVKQDDKKSDKSWLFESAYFFKDSLVQKPLNFNIERKDIKGNRVIASHKEVSVTFNYENLTKKLVLRMYPETNFIACDAYYKGNLSGVKANSISLFKNETKKRHWKYKSVEFFDQTDHHNTLVHEHHAVGFDIVDYLKGNLLFTKNLVSNNSFLILKEAPCSFVQLNHPGHDFVVNKYGIDVKGIGFKSSDIDADNWTKAYSIAITGTESDELSQLKTLRAYHKSIRTHNSDWDEMIMMNTWGDRNRDANISEAFVKKQIDACKQLGITHFQIDDGWQQGLSKNSSVTSGNKWMSWEEEDWQPHKDRFSNGFQTVAEYAKNNDVMLGLWFAPSSVNSYKRWKIDADILINLHKNYGVNYFKIDGVSLPDKLAEENLRRLYARVLEKTNNQVFFNMDATSNFRAGYHFLYEYGGNIFLENRYTTFKKYYYPYQTLRNVWMLSKYVPTERLQIEFLNKWKNTENYSPEDEFAPINVPFNYTFAVTMMAQPLAWFEGTGLPEEALSVADVIGKYKVVKEEIHEGVILPIGDEPNGRSWTGFQSITSDLEGYFMIYREQNDIDSKAFDTYLDKGKTYKFTKILGSGNIQNNTPKEQGAVTFTLDRPQSYLLLHYKEN